MQSQHSVSTTVAVSANSARMLMSAIFTMTLGVALVFTVGFAPLDVAHNAAHDTRHTSAFPCH